MSALYNSALRQSKSLRASLDDLASNSSPQNSAALQGQITTLLTSFTRTLDDYQKSLDSELIPDKKGKGSERISNFRSDLLEFKSRYAELKAEREQQVHVEQRSELFGQRRGYTGGGSETPENPYSDKNVAATVAGKGPGLGENVNPLFRTSNPNFTPGAQGGNSYSAYQSPYGLGADQSREDHALKENSFFSSANTTLDEYLERGRAVLGDLGDQREMLKGTQRKLYDIGTTLGISGDTIRMVNRRAKQDKWIFWGGVVVFIIFVYFVLKWLR